MGLLAMPEGGLKKKLPARLHLLQYYIPLAFRLSDIGTGRGLY